MLDVSLSELAVIIVVAVLVIGPKELPTVIRTFARWLGKARSMVRELKSHMDLLGEESGLNEVKRSFDQEVRYITDLEGKPQPTYDISDILPPEKKPDDPKTSD